MARRVLTAALAAAGAAAVAVVPVLHRAHTPRTVVDDIGQATATPGSCQLRWTGGRPLPDPVCTPGAVDPALTARVICAPGWSTATVRPASSATARAKKWAAAAYGIPVTAGEFDHLVSLELGGASSTSNLWIEPPGPGDPPGGIPNQKDQVENTLHRAVCAGRLTLAQAQQRIAGDWTTALVGVGPSN